MRKEFSDLVGKTIYAIEGRQGGDEMIFRCKEGDDYVDYRMYHSQDCCERVYIEDICGDLKDLLNTPILKASEDTNSNENPANASYETFKYQESFTWTFYNIATIKGSVTIRWYGESNGYYSESVDFCKT